MANSTPSYEQLEFERRGRVGLITLNRPQKLNAWTPTMETEFLDVLERTASDREVAVLVVTGAGRAFCAGVWAAKRLLHENAVEGDLRRVVTQEGYAIREMRRQPDHAEAVRAFVEKRPPKFSG